MTFGLMLEGLVVIIGSVLLHELAHLAYFEKLNKTVKVKLYYESWRKFGIRIGTPEDYETMTPKQYYMLNLVGVITGLLPIMLAMFHHAFFAWLFIPYLLGSKHDIVNMYQSWRGELE